nr:MAG TPA: hypothetical protein [Caudoviricetes sp.]
MFAVSRFILPGSKIAEYSMVKPKISDLSVAFLSCLLWRKIPPATWRIKPRPPKNTRFCS